MHRNAKGTRRRRERRGAVVATHCTGASVTTLAYDALDRLVQADQDGLVSHYAYDHAGRRIRKTVAGATVNYLYNGPDILAEYGSWGKADASYVHGPATDDPLLRQTAANDVSYHHADGLGSIVAHTDATSRLTAAQLYDAWGQPHASARLGSLGQYGYTGREPDETGLMYYRARYYDPAIGRFTQRDPLGMPDGVNRYAYVANSPTNFTDPTGEFVMQLGGGLVNAGAGLVVNIGSAMLQNKPIDPAKLVKDVALDFFVGAASSGLAVSQKFAKAAELANGALKYTNVKPVKFATAFGAEVAKSTYNCDNGFQTGVSAVTNALLNATGALGKLSSNLLGKSGAEASQALFRPSEMETLAASAIIESRAGVVVGGAIDYAKSLFETPTTSGTQNMSNYASPTIGMDSGVPWGTNLLGDYTSSGILSCRKCQF